MSLAAPAVAPLPGASEALATLGRAAVILGGALVFGFNGIALALIRPGLASAAAFVLLLAAWLAGLALRSPATAPACTGALLAFLVLPAALHDAGMQPWVVVGVITTAIAVSAALSMPNATAWLFIGASLAISAAYAAFPSQGTASDLSLPVIGGWAAPLFNASIAAGITIWRTAWVDAAREADAALASAESELARARREAAVSEARLRVVRQLHETVLNTLGAIASGTADASVAALRRTCRADLRRVAQESQGDATAVPRLPETGPGSLADDLPIIVLLTRRRRLRAGAAFPVAFGIVTVPLVALSLPVPAALLATWAAFVAVLAVLVLRWRHRVALSSAAFALLSLTSLSVTLQHALAPQATRSALDWLISTGAIAMIVPLLGIATAPVARIAFPWLLLAINVIGVAVTWTGTLTGPIVSLVVSTAYLGTIAYAAVWLFARIDARRAQALAVLRQAWADDDIRVHRAELESAWAAVSRATRELLSGVGDGSIDPRDPAAIVRAQVEATILRSRLRMARNPSSGMQASLARLMDIASAHEVPLEVRVLVPSTTAEGLPAAVEAALAELVTRADGAPVTMSLIGGDPDELVIVAPVGLASAITEAPLDGGWVAHLEEAGSGLARMSLTCDSLAGSPVAG